VKAIDQANLDKENAENVDANDNTTEEATD
jgi:hypothetical protein